MKKHFTLLNLFLVLSLCAVSYLSYDVYKIQQIINKVEAVNARIDELRNEGYSTLSAKHIADVEFGIVPADDEYRALIED